MIVTGMIGWRYIPKYMIKFVMMTVAAHGVSGIMYVIGIPGNMTRSVEMIQVVVTGEICFVNIH